MAQVDFDYTVFDPAMQNAADRTLLTKFYTEAVQDEAASLAAGHPVFKDVDWIDIRAPGSPQSLVRRPITRRDMQRFGDRYQNWKKTGTIAPLNGMPLTEWTGITRAQAEELKYKNIFTVEDLANLSDNNVGNIMNFYGLKQSAVNWLARAREEAPLIKLQEEVARRDAENQLMKDALMQMQAKIDAMEGQQVVVQQPAMQMQAPTVNMDQINAMIQQGIASALQANAAVTPKAKTGRPRKTVVPPVG